MEKIHIKLLSEDGLAYLKKNIESVTKKIQENEIGDWVKKDFTKPMFVEKNIEIEDFEIQSNPESKDKDIDLQNSITLYSHLKDLPRYILCDEKFWLWLHFEKFYKEVRTMMTVKSASTITDHWMHNKGVRRGLMFGVLSRMFFRVAFTIDKNNADEYHLTKWVIDNPERLRNLTWRSFSSQTHLVRGIVKAEKEFFTANPTLEKNLIYPEIAKSVSIIGSVRLLDAISEEDIYKIMLEEIKNIAIEI